MASTALIRRLLQQLGQQPQALGHTLQGTCPAPASQPLLLLQRAAASTQASAASGRLFGVCVLERLPVVTPEEPEWEREHRAWQMSVRAKYFKELPAEFTDLKDSEVADEAGSRYEPAPRATEADEHNDRRSLRRRLDQRLFMLVRPSGGNSSTGGGGSWALPQREHGEGETMRQTAERALAEAVDTSAVQPYFVGNAPAGHVQLQDGTLFFHRCQLVQGAPALRGGSSYSEHVWVAKDELPEYIHEPALLQLLQKML